MLQLRGAASTNSWSGGPAGPARKWPGDSGSLRSWLGWCWCWCPWCPGHQEHHQGWALGSSLRTWQHPTAARGFAATAGCWESNAANPEIQALQSGAGCGCLPQFEMFEIDICHFFYDVYKIKVINIGHVTTMMFQKVGQNCWHTSSTYIVGYVLEAWVWVSRCLKDWICSPRP